MFALKGLKDISSKIKVKARLHYLVRLENQQNEIRIRTLINFRTLALNSDCFFFKIQIKNLKKCFKLVI
jgi:biotin synthase-like enzyme